MSYESRLVHKPWGFEYQVYRNSDLVIWFLTINKDQETSLHCHSNKDTGLIALEGKGELEFLSSSHGFSSPYKTMIRRGIFHRTKAVGGPVKLFEVETSGDRHDLIRLSDSYNRESKDYEAGQDYETEKLDFDSEGVQSFCGRQLEIKLISSKESLEDLYQHNILVFLTGGIFTSSDLRVLKPGDIISGNVLKKLVARFTVIPSKIMVVK
jgi:mannose-6-phosphate isomerase-like protein (cupin superfamily)